MYIYIYTLSITSTITSLGTMDSLPNHVEINHLVASFHWCPRLATQLAHHGTMNSPRHHPEPETAEG